MGLDKPTPSAFALKGNLKEPMTNTIIVTETFTRCYELEVDNLDEDTIQTAIGNYVPGPHDEPEWVGTCVTDENGSEVLDY